VEQKEASGIKKRAPWRAPAFFFLRSDLSRKGKLCLSGQKNAVQESTASGVVLVPYSLEFQTKQLASSFSMIVSVSGQGRTAGGGGEKNPPSAKRFQSLHRYQRHGWARRPAAGNAGADCEERHHPY
jgi:hypothetical protein